MHYLSSFFSVIHDFDTEKYFEAEKITIFKNHHPPTENVLTNWIRYIIGEEKKEKSIEKTQIKKTGLAYVLSRAQIFYR